MLWPYAIAQWTTHRIENIGRLFSPAPRMIELTDQDVAEFREIVRQHTGKELSDDEARAQARSLLQLVAFAMKPLPPPAPPEQ